MLVVMMAAVTMRAMFMSFRSLDRECYPRIV